MKCSEKPWFFQFNYWVVFAMAFLPTFLHGYGQTRLLAVALVLTALVWQFNARTSVLRMPKPLELKCYTFWGIWAILTGFIVAKVPELVWFNGKTFLQMALLFWCSYALFLRQRKYNYIYIAIIFVAIVQVAASVFGYHLDRDVAVAGGEVVRDVLDADKTRIEGLAGNANAMGFQMLAGVWACLMLWSEKKVLWKFIKWSILIGLIVVFSYYTIQTASRKSLLVLMVLIGGWGTWVLPGKFSVKAFLISVGVAIVLLVAGFIIVEYVMDDTLAGARFRQLFDRGGGSAVAGFQEDVRYSMYIDGLKFWASHPIAGIGLGNFLVWHWSGLYSHSDYIEPLACTGLVGFVAYQGFAVVILARLLKLIRVKRIPDHIRYTLKCMILFVACNHFMIGFGCPHWMSIQHEMIMVVIGTYSWKARAEWVRGRLIYGT